MILYTYIFQATLLEFDWRNVFKESSLAMGHCISTAIEGFSTKVLQQEQMERTSAVNYTMNLVNVPKVWREGHIYPEEEQPKKVAKASIRGDCFKLLLAGVALLLFILSFCKCKDCKSSLQIKWWCFLERTWYLDILVFFSGIHTPELPKWICVFLLTFSPLF